MLKKFLFVAVLLLFVSVQALTASCDLRCLLMGASTGCHTSQTNECMPHCHDKSMEQDKQAGVIATNSCAPGGCGCGTGLTAITKSADQNDAGRSKLLVSAVALLVDPSGNSGSNRTTALAALSRRSDSRPHAQRRGSSLRI